METYCSNRLTIELHNEELDAMREVLRLAHERLRNAALVKMSGSPLERQAGLVGQELFRVKTMIEKLGKAVEIDLPYDAKPDSDPEITGAPLVFSFAFSSEAKK